MIELINRIATGRTTIDDADAVRAMVAALLNSLAFAAWCAKHAHDEETKTSAAACGPARPTRWITEVNDGRRVPQ